MSCEEKERGREGEGRGEGGFFDLESKIDRMSKEGIEREEEREREGEAVDGIRIMERRLRRERRKEGRRKEGRREEGNEGWKEKDETE